MSRFILAQDPLAADTRAGRHPPRLWDVVRDRTPSMAALGGVGVSRGLGTRVGVVLGVGVGVDVGVKVGITVGVTVGAGVLVGTCKVACSSALLVWSASSSSQTA
jgi:hypothetical protein